MVYGMMYGNDMGGMMYGGGDGFFRFASSVSLILFIGITILVYLWIIKLWKDVFGKTVQKSGKSK